MQKNSQATTDTQSPFFELLAEAEEIKIREVCAGNEARVGSALESSMKAMENGEEGTHRAFFIYLKSKPAPKPAAELKNGETAENRVYLLKSAELLIVDGDYVLARNIYSYLLKINLRDTDSMRGLGICFVQLGETTSAKKCFKALLELDGREESLVWLGQCYVAEGNDTAALDCFHRIKDIAALTKQEQFDLHKELGNCETRRGKFDEAWSYYHKSLQLQPQSEVIYVNLGTLEVQRQHPEIAFSYFNKAVELNPSSSRGHCGLGLVAMAKNDGPTAVKSFLKALDVDSQNLVALYQLIKMAKTTDQYATVKDRLQKYLARDSKNTEMLYAYAVVLFKEGSWTTCEKTVDQLLALDAAHAKGRTLREELSSAKYRPS